MKTSSFNQKIHSNLNKPTSLKKDWKNLPQNDPYLKVASSMEAEFLKLMLEKMQDTVTKDEKDSGEEAYYKSLLLRERANIMAARDKGIGIKELILDQIYPKN